MSDQSPGKDTLREVIVDNIPERCRECPLIGKYVAACVVLLEAQRLTPATRRALVRLTFPRTGESCPRGVNSDGTCGSRV